MLKSRAEDQAPGFSLTRRPKKPKNQKFSDPGPFSFKQLNLEL